MVSTCLTRRKSCSYSTTSKPPTLTTKPSTSSALAVSEILLSRFLNSQKSYSPSNQIYLTRSPSNSTEELKLKYIIANVDENLKLFIRLLAPYFLNTATHKVLEYLIRVYEIHAFHKHLLIYSFLPYFETSFFLRMIQLLNIKQDEMMYFMESFAYSGDAIDKKSLIKGLARNNGTLFAKYAEYSFNLSTLLMGICHNVENCLHWNFFGTMLVEILRSNKEDENLLFNDLPFISQGLTLPIKDLRTAFLMGISHIACR